MPAAPVTPPEALEAYRLGAQPPEPTLPKPIDFLYDAGSTTGLGQLMADSGGIAMTRSPFRLPFLVGSCPVVTTLTRPRDLFLPWWPGSFDLPTYKPSRRPARRLLAIYSRCRNSKALPTNVYALPLVQHYIHGFGTVECPQLGYRLCPTTRHIPNSIAPAFQAVRFDFDDIY